MRPALAVRAINTPVLIGLVIALGVLLSIMLYSYYAGWIGAAKAPVTAALQVMQSEPIGGNKYLVTLDLKITNMGKTPYTIKSIKLYFTTEGGVSSVEFTPSTEGNEYSVSSTSSPEWLDATNSKGDGDTTVPSKGTADITLNLIIGKNYVPFKTVYAKVVLNDPAGNEVLVTTKPVEVS